MRSILLELKTEVNISPLIGDFNVSLSPRDKASPLKISRETSDLNDITHQKDLTDMCRLFHLNNKEYAFYSVSHRNFSNMPFPVTKHNC